jgi:hypothetical protein
MSLLANIGKALAWRVAGDILRKRGWDVPDDLDGVMDAIDKLKGLLGSEEAVIESLQQPKICGVPDCLVLENRRVRWPADEITYGLSAAMPGMSQEAWEECHRLAWGTFEQVCGLSIKYNPNPRTANILVTVGHIDGSGGTLAWSELANGRMEVKTQKYDSSDRWRTAQTGRGIYVPAVIRHEGGHAIGSPHLKQGALLQPTYDERVLTFTDIDIDYFQNTLGYGKPKRDLPPPVDPAPSRDLFVTMAPDQRLIVTVKQ